MNGYQLTDAWFEFRFQHPEKVSHAHTELYFYLLYHWNKLSQKEKFGLPSGVTMEATGIRNYKTYKKCIKDLAEFGFIRIISEATNQHQAMVVAWGKNTKADTEALTEAVTKAQVEALPHIVELNNYRTKELKKVGLDFSKYEELSKLVEKWIGYRKSIKKPFKSQDSLDAFVKHLRQLSGNDYQKADAIIEQSIANQWQGVFELKQKSNAGSNNSQLPVDASQIVNYGKGNGKCFLDKKSGLWYEPLTNGYLPKEISDYYYYDQGNHSNYGDYVRWMIENNKTPLPPEDMRYFPADWNFEKFVSEQRAIVASSNF
jgi:hypothetical protein